MPAALISLKEGRAIGKQFYISVPNDGCTYTKLGASYSLTGTLSVWLTCSFVQPLLILKATVRSAQQGTSACLGRDAGAGFSTLTIVTARPKNSPAGLIQPLCPKTDSRRTN